MPTARPRSVSQSQITVIDPGNPDTACLDPFQLLDPIISQLRSLDVPLVVKITDGVTTVEYTLAIFTSKLWPIRDGKVVFGLKKVVFDEIKASISVTIITVKEDQH